MPSSWRSEVEIPSLHHNDPDQLVVCPYDPVHRIRAKVLPYHLQKCRRQYPSSDYRTCPFNARHEMPTPEYDLHVETCEDRHSIAQDFAHAAHGHGYVAGHFSVPESDSFETDKDECWDDEVDESVGTRGINFSNPDVDAFSELRVVHEAQLKQSSVLAQSKPVNLSGEYDDGLTPGERIKMEEERKLEAIRQEYPLLNGKESGSFIDYKSILHIHCQKHRINAPKFREAPGVMGGFGAECIVMTNIFRSKICAKKKKDALQDAAKQALLGLNIDVGPDPTPCKPAHLRTTNERQRIREIDELQRSAPTLRQPRLQQIPRPPAMSETGLVNQMSNMSVHETMSYAGRGRGRVSTKPPPSPGLQSQAAQVSPSASAASSQEEKKPDDEWTVVPQRKGKKPAGAGNPVFQHSLNMAGRGRGRR